MWMRSRDNGLAAVLYGPSRVTTMVAGTKVDIVESTDYPFSDRIELRIATDRPARFPLYLRLPSWCAHYDVTVNGSIYHISDPENGFTVIRGVQFHRDTIELKLSMAVALGRSGDSGVFLERGPLVYSLQPQEQWRGIPMPEFEITSPDYFPMWAVSATSPWNYGLCLDAAASLDREVRFVTRASSDPWTVTKCNLRISARQIHGWDLLQTGKDRESLQTPPLPESANQLGKLESLSLVPLGCTHLRLTVFPHLSR